jgi:large subunit ribosomal protein L30
MEQQEQQQQRKCLAVVRVRGVSDVFREINQTMKMLHLERNCHAALVDNRVAYLGMLKKAQNYLTWGEISKDILASLLKKRGRLVGNKKLTDEYAQKLGHQSLDELAEAMFKGEVEYNRLPDIKPVFRLHPPSKGFKGKVKKSFASGGVTGYRGEDINALLKQMI